MAKKRGVYPSNIRSSAHSHFRSTRKVLIVKITSSAFSNCQCYNVSNYRCYLCFQLPPLIMFQLPLLKCFQLPLLFMFQLSLLLVIHLQQPLLLVTPITTTANNLIFSALGHKGESFPAIPHSFINNA